MNKILTVSIAAYNVEKYIKNTLDSLLVDNIDDLEILVEDDGGTDNTASIVKKYEEKYPGIIKLVHKENGGYGSTINKSIELAQGKYFKQLDGDDWYDSENFKKFLELLRTIDVDMVYTPYKVYNENKQSFELRDYFEEKIKGENDFDEIILKSKQYLEMYTNCYKTEILRKCKLKLLEKCFYTDTQYSIIPMCEISKIFVVHFAIYTYRVGRDEQSVSVYSKRKHYKEHEEVSKALIDFYNSITVGNEKKKYILNYISIIVSMTIANFYMLLDGSRQHLDEIKRFENYIYQTNKEIYYMMNEKSKTVKLLRKTNYNYLIYCIIGKLKKIK